MIEVTVPRPSHNTHLWGGAEALLISNPTAWAGVQEEEEAFDLLKAWG